MRDAPEEHERSPSPRIQDDAKFCDRLSAVLHEAGHNLGPSHDYLAEGKKDSVVFGGPLASMLELI